MAFGVSVALSSITANGRCAGMLAMVRSIQTPWLDEAIMLTRRALQCIDFPVINGIRRLPLDHRLGKKALRLPFAPNRWILLFGIK
eukprot:scaffold376_cov454-Pavlova_lutheri.AAC.15